MRVKYTWELCTKYDASYNGAVYNLHDDYTIEHKTTSISVRPSVHIKDLYWILDNVTDYGCDGAYHKQIVKADKILDVIYRKALKNITYDQFFDILKLTKYDMAKLIIDHINEIRI